MTMHQGICQVELDVRTQSWTVIQVACLTTHPVIPVKGSVHLVRVALLLDN